MVHSVTFLPSVGGSGLVVTDDANPNTGLADGGHRERFVPALAQVVDVAEFVVERALEAAASAAAAAGGVTTNSTSPSTATLPAVAGTLTLTGIASTSTYQPGMKIAAVSTTNPTTKGAYGTVSAWTPGAGPNTGSLSIVAEEVVGSGSVTGWSISLSSFGVPKARTISTSGLATGGGDLSANRTINVPKASAATVRAGTNDTDAMTALAMSDSAAFQVLTDGATIAFDVSLGYNGRVTLGGNRVFGAPTNVKDGLTYTINIKQPASGGPWTPSFNSYFDFGAVLPSFSTTANKVDKVTFQHNADTGKGEASIRRGS